VHPSLVNEYCRSVTRYLETEASEKKFGNEKLANRRTAVGERAGRTDDDK